MYKWEYEDENGELRFYTSVLFNHRKRTFRMGTPKADVRHVVRWTFRVQHVDFPEHVSHIIGDLFSVIVYGLWQEHEYDTHFPALLDINPCAMFEVYVRYGEKALAVYLSWMFGYKIVNAETRRRPSADLVGRIMLFHLNFDEESERAIYCEIEEILIQLARDGWLTRKGNGAW